MSTFFTTVDIINPLNVNGKDLQPKSLSSTLKRLNNQKKRKNINDK